MSSDSRKINLVIRDKSFQIDFTTDFDLLNKEIISILESELDKKLQEKKNLYKLYYFDDDRDKYFICNQSDYTFFVNDKLCNIYVDINDFSINQIDSSKNEIEDNNNTFPKSNEFILYQKIDELSKLNLELKKEKEISNEKNKIYLERIKILEEDKKLKQEKEQSILQCLAQEQNEKKLIMEELEESKKLNESMTFTINNISTIVNDNDESAKDILLNNLKEEKALLENQLKEEREKMDLMEKIYNEDNQMLQQKLDSLIKDNNLIIQNEVQKGINNYINQSKIELQNKENEINNIKNDYQNNINKIREECYDEIEQKFSKVYENKLKEIYDTLINNSKQICDQIISKNEIKFEEEEKKRNQVIDANIFNNAHENFNINPVYKCKTVHNGITCNSCKKCPIVGYRYKCMECDDYNLCQICEKVVEHEHNFIKFVNEEKE